MSFMFHRDSRISFGRAAWMLALAAFGCTIVPQALAQGGFNGAGRYTIFNAESGKVIDLDRNDGTTVIQYESRDTDNQVWEVRSAGNGLWTIRNVMNGNALEASRQAKGGPVRGNRTGGGDAQLWRIENGRNGNATLIAVSGGALDVPDSSHDNGVRLQTWERNDSGAQQWQFRAASRGGNWGGGGGGSWSDRARGNSSRLGSFGNQGTYEIVSVNSGKVLDMDRNDRSTILQYEPRQTDNQVWEVRDAGQGEYYIVNRMNGYALEAGRGGKGVQARATPFRSLDSQRWRIEPVGDGYMIISRFGTVLDVPDSNRDNGVRIQLWERNDSKAQQWRLNAVSSGSWNNPSRRGYDEPNQRRGDSGALTPNPPDRGRDAGALSQGDAVDACQRELRRKFLAEFGNGGVSFRSTETASAPGNQLAVRGRGNLTGRRQLSFDYQCVVNLRTGQVLSSNYSSR